MILLVKIYNKINFLEYIYNLLKTKLFYKLIFAKIGEKSIIYKPLKLINPQNIEVNDCVYIYKNIRLEAVTSWNKKKYNPKIKICNNVNIEQNVHITCAEKIEIGENTSILAYSLLTDINHKYTDIKIGSKNQNIYAEPIKIGKNCFIGMGVKILPGVELGDNCIVGANSVLKREKYPDGCVIAGIPAKIIKIYNYKKKIWEKNEIID